MSFTGKEDHSISLTDASRLTKNFREKAEKKSTLGGFFGKDTLLKILNQEGCVGIRFYLGQQADGTPDIIIVGADKEQNDMVEGILGERSVRCPPYCGANNQLNS